MKKQNNGQTSDLKAVTRQVVDWHDIVFDKLKRFAYYDIDEKVIIIAGKTFKIARESGYDDKYSVRNVNKWVLLDSDNNVIREVVLDTYQSYTRWSSVIVDFFPDIELINVPFNELTYENQVSFVKNEIVKTNKSFITIACALGVIDTTNYKDIYRVAEEEFGFGKTTVKNMLAIYKKFCLGMELKESYVDYSYSQLAELTSVSEELLDKFNSSMTIKDIRKKKKELISSSSNSIDGDLSNVNNDVSENVSEKKIVLLGVEDVKRCFEEVCKMKFTGSSAGVLKFAGLLAEALGVELVEITG